MFALGCGVTGLAVMRGGSGARASPRAVVPRRIAPRRLHHRQHRQRPLGTAPTSAWACRPGKAWSTRCAPGSRAARPRRTGTFPMGRATTRARPRATSWACSISATAGASEPEHRLPSPTSLQLVKTNYPAEIEPLPVPLGRAQRLQHRRHGMVARLARAGQDQLRRDGDRGDRRHRDRTTSSCSPRQRAATPPGRASPPITSLPPPRHARYPWTPRGGPGALAAVPARA